MVTATALRARPRAELDAWLETLTPAEADALIYDWPFWARASQRQPVGDWLVWLFMGGRGTGKSRAGAEAVREWVLAGTGQEHIALVGKTPAEVRDVMIANPLKSGLLDVFPPAQRPVYLPSRGAIRFHTGAVAHVYSGEEPNSLRGPAHSHAWCDELPKFQYPSDVWNNLMLGLRAGLSPRCVVTTTPLPIPLLRRIMADPKTVVTRGTTYENLANLAPTFREQVLRLYEGTRLGRQELMGELLEDTPGALWTYERFRHVPAAPPLQQVVVAIDPAVTATAESDETGIVVAGLGEDGCGYVLHDASGRYSPQGWADRALDCAEAFETDHLVAEVNNGGDMVRHTLQLAARARGTFVRVQTITATRGKYLRAEPVAALYEQGRVAHVGPPGTFDKLERQMAEWVPGLASPDRLDALVYSLTTLFVRGRQAAAAQAAEAEPEAPGDVVRAAIQRDGLYWPGGVS